MAVLGVKKGIDHKKHEHGSATTKKSLPKELLVEIFAKVGTRSIVDLCMVKLCSKDFLHAAEDNYVYRHASMENFALVPLRWFTSEKESSFLKRGKQSGNSEIAYREGMVQYFTSSMVESGLDNLKKAALEGHDEAKYVYCMLLMCREEERERKQGFDIFCSLKASRCVSRCRNIGWNLLSEACGWKIITLWWEITSFLSVVPVRVILRGWRIFKEDGRPLKMKMLVALVFRVNVAVRIMNLVYFATCLESKLNLSSWNKRRTDQAHENLRS